FAREDKPVNVLDARCLTQLERLLDTLEREPPRVLVLESGLPSCFIAGADLDAIAAVSDAGEAARLAERGQALCRRIEVLPSVSVAVVQGACLGGGLELAMACDHILAVEHPATKLALPEIRLGIHPGFGGTVRLPQRVGWVSAVELILSGKGLSARRAARSGLAAMACAPEQVAAAIEHLAAKGKRSPRVAGPWWLYLPGARQLFFRQVARRALARFRHVDVEKAYPALPATITLLRGHVGRDMGTSLACEAASLGRLAVTPSCKHLIQVFHLGNALRKQEAVRRGRAASERVQRTAVFGAGVMGSGIAWVAAGNTEVDLHDVAPDALARGMKAVAELAAKTKDRTRMQRIRPALDDSGLRDADVVIEAVIEDIDTKCALWRRLEGEVRKDCLLLSNTSSLSIGEMQDKLRHPERLVGLHFFNPAPKMPLVEVVAGAKSSATVVDQVAALAVSWGKYPVIVADRPGFLVNRCLMPFMVSALRLLEHGQKAEHIDGALKHFGMPMGALELADQVGLDICVHVGRHLSNAFGARFAMPAWLARMVDDGLLGAKGGKGFFRYDPRGKRQEFNPDVMRYLGGVEVEPRESAADVGTHDAPVLPHESIVDDCLLPMLVEALAALAEGVVREPTHLEAAFIYGIGFPAFRGGLLRTFAQRPRKALAAAIEARDLPMPENLEVLDAFGQPG
ncbi:MAG: fatty oxidation complex subunit alpha, partial [Zetaproteobacteria bacterium]